LLQADRIDQQIPDALATAPGGLGTWCLSYLEELFMIHATRTAQWLSAAAADEAILAGDIEALGSLVCDALRQAIG
jgi:hypothetical protein